MSETSRRDRVVFRLPWATLLFPLLLFFCATPLATVRPWLLWLYLIPLLALVYVPITRTVADNRQIQAFGLTGRRRISWEDLDGFEFRGPRWAMAVTTGGRRVRLPMVRPRDLPVLAEVSGGWLRLGDQAPDPEPEPEPDEAEDPAGDDAGTGDPDTGDLAASDLAAAPTGAAPTEGAPTDAGSHPEVPAGARPDVASTSP